MKELKSILNNDGSITTECPECGKNMIIPVKVLLIKCDCGYQVPWKIRIKDPKGRY